MSDVMWISRDWRLGLVESAEIGYDSDPPNRAARWVVRTGRTASGVGMERTDEPMITLSEFHVSSEAEASAWLKENGYY